jgi:hypothetical protein
MVEVSCNAIISKSCISFEKNVSQKVLPNLVEKTKQEYVFQN